MICALCCDLKALNISEPMSPVEDLSVVSGSFGRNVSVTGNQIMIQDSLPGGSAPVVDAPPTPEHKPGARPKSAEAAPDVNKLRR